MRRDLASLLCVMAYLTGAEIVWRQVRAPVFYLAAPYLLIALSVFAVILVLGHLGRDSRLAMLYCGLLVPAIISTIRTTGTGSRELIAFALSGPIALGAFVAFTSQVKVDRSLYRRILWTTLITAIGPLTIAVQTTRSQLATQGSIQFKSASNFVTSGGFGPVQVSSMLSLGAMAAVLLILSEGDKFVRILAGVAASALVVQTLLTFSRGGSTSLAIAVTGLALVNTKSPRIRNRILVIAAVAFTVGYLLVFPWLETFTGGAFNERFSDRQSARTTLAGNDVQIFEDNFLFGVGPGHDQVPAADLRHLPVALRQVQERGLLAHRVHPHARRTRNSRSHRDCDYGLARREFIPTTAVRAEPWLSPGCSGRSRRCSTRTCE